MGNFLRLVVFILALGVLAAGTGALLLQERHRENVLERELLAAAAPDVPAAVEAVRAHHVRTQRGLLLLGGLGFACLVALAVVPARVTPPAPTTDPARARTEMRGLESLARATNAQRVELDHEREARHRSEQDLHLQQVLANHALQDKVRLGRDLHDGLIQTLYATGLVLETAMQKLADAPADPAEAGRLLERAKTTLNAAIREARGTIGGLTPDALEEQSFPEAVHAIVEHLDGGRLRERRVEIDPRVPAFAEPARTELLQIVREAVSNALRHGAARRLEIILAPVEKPGEPASAAERLRLMVRDDGKGFDPGAVTRGHGLDNLAARARALGATLDIDSAPGRGSTLTLVFAANDA
jgi:signal transduction histidine kinase